MVGRAGNTPHSITLFTIGFTGKSAEQFFGALTSAGVGRLLDIRLNNVSQLAGFSKKKDLEYFLRVIGGIDYAHNLDLAPTQDILKAYQNKQIDWSTYESKFVELLHQREPESKLSREELDLACLLCSENEPEHCHRRLVAEYLRQIWEDVTIRHL